MGATTYRFDKTPICNRQTDTQTPATAYTTLAKRRAVKIS